MGREPLGQLGRIFESDFHGQVVAVIMHAQDVDEQDKEVEEYELNIIFDSKDRLKFDDIIARFGCTFETFEDAQKYLYSLSVKDVDNLINDVFWEHGV